MSAKSSASSGPANPEAGAAVRAPVAARQGTLQVLGDAWTIAHKDLRVEMRSKEILLTMGYFGFLVVLIFSFSFFNNEAPISAVSAGILWVSVAFAGTLGLGRIMEREKEGDCIRALLLSPVSRAAIYLGKTIGVLAFMAVVEAVIAPSVYFFFNLDLDLEQVGLLFATLGLGTFGYAVVGTLLAAMLQRARAKDVLLAIILCPLVLPIVIVGVKATAALIDPDLSSAEFGAWVRLLAVFDIVFLIAALWLFEPLVMD